MIQISQNILKSAGKSRVGLYRRIRFVHPAPPDGSRRLAPSSSRRRALRDDPVLAMLMLGALVASILLALRHAAPGSGAAEMVGRQLALLAGPLGCTILVAVISTTLTLPLLGTGHPLIARLMAWGMPIFDEAVTLAMVLSVAAALGAMVAMGRPGLPFAWFVFQAVLAWGCHRLRLQARPA